MYVSTNPRAQFWAGLGRLVGTAARGTSAVVRSRRAKQERRAAALAETSGEAAESCTPCAEEEARMRAEAQAWMDGL